MFLSIKRKIPVWDFVLISGQVESPGIKNTYTQIKVSPETNIFYQSSTIDTHCNLIIDNGRIIIEWRNGFYPLFYYRVADEVIITPDYTHLLNSCIPFSIDADGIREFVLFNTPLTDRTFHREIKRLFRVDQIEIENAKISISQHKKVPFAKPVLDQFNESVASEIKRFQTQSHAVFLSGGGESRINAAITHANRLNKNFITWGHPEDKEYIIASRIARQLQTRLLNIRPDCNNLPYEELLNKTGFLVNMQYAYRFVVIKQLFEQYQYEVVWTGWGDINGYPVRYQPTELFSAYYLGLYAGEKHLPAGWNREWLEDYIHKDNPINMMVRSNPGTSTFFALKRKILAPAIFGAVLGSENTYGKVVAPWFNPNIYSSVYFEEKQHNKLIAGKIWRSLWKNELYYKLIKQYCQELNFVKNAKGYYPWLVHKRTGLPGLFFAALLKKCANRRKYPFDPVEDRMFIKNELEHIFDDGCEMFNKKGIKQIIQQSDNWRGPDILEYFKLIQVNWFLNRYH